MEGCVPVRWLSAERAQLMGAGADSSMDVASRVFPPREGDPDGALALAALETLTNNAMRAAFHDSHSVLAPSGIPTGTERRLTGEERQWWIEGLATGFCEEAAAALTTYATHNDSTPLDELDAMRNRVVRSLAGVHSEAADTVFALTQALLERDDVAVAWAAEHLFVAPSTQPLTSDDVRDRIRLVTAAAAFTCAAAWQLVLSSDQ